jgi:hypothetical protein
MREKPGREAGLSGRAKRYQYLVSTGTLIVSYRKIRLKSGFSRMTRNAIILKIPL